jgi:hypothetical protein
VLLSGYANKHTAAECPWLQRTFKSKMSWQEKFPPAQKLPNPRLTPDAVITMMTRVIDAMPVGPIEARPGVNHRSIAIAIRPGIPIPVSIRIAVPIAVTYRHSKADAY